MSNIKTIQSGIARFLDCEFIPNIKKTHSAVASYGISVAAALAIDNLGNTMDKLTKSPVVSYLGIIDDEQNIDVDKLCQQMRKSMPEEGLKVSVPLVGLITFTREDVDALEQYIKM